MTVLLGMGFAVFIAACAGVLGYSIGRMHERDHVLDDD